MIDQILLLFQALFLVLLYLFIWRVVRSARRDLRLPQESFVLTPAQAAAQGFPVQPAAPSQRLVIESSPSLQPERVMVMSGAPLRVPGSGNSSMVSGFVM